MKKLIFLSAVLLFVASCGSERKPRKPSATGRANEMLVVIDDNFWEGETGDIIRSYFADAQPMLPQPESMFDLRPINKENFTSLFETHRNILMIEIDPALEEPKLETRRDIWSYPQRVVRIYTPSNNLLEETLDRSIQRLVDLYLETERERLINAYKMMVNREARSTLRNKYNVSLAVPEGYFIAIEEENFVWLRRTGTREDLEMGLLLTILPYTDPGTDFDYNVIWQRRDSITRKHIAGEIPGSYMGTYEDIPPLKREIDFNGKYAVKLRGLWRMYGDFMGGPFVNYTFVDEATNRLINIDVFVWAPDFDKRDHIRQVEALAYSLEFPHEMETEAVVIEDGE